MKKKKEREKPSDACSLNSQPPNSLAVGPVPAGAFLPPTRLIRGAAPLEATPCPRRTPFCPSVTAVLVAAATWGVVSLLECIDKASGTCGVITGAG